MGSHLNIMDRLNRALEQYEAHHVTKELEALSISSSCISKATSEDNLATVRSHPTSAPEQSIQASIIPSLKGEGEGKGKDEEHERERERQKARQRDMYMERVRHRARELEEKRRKADATRKMEREEAIAAMRDDYERRRRLVEQQKERELTKLEEQLAQVMIDNHAAKMRREQDVGEKKFEQRKREAGEFRKPGYNPIQKFIKDQKKRRPDGGVATAESAERRKEMHKKHREQDRVIARGRHVKQHGKEDAQQEEEERRKSRERHEQMRRVVERKKQLDRRRHVDRELQKLQDREVPLEKLKHARRAREKRKAREEKRARDRERQSKRQHRYLAPDYIIAVTTDLPPCRLLFPPGSIGKGQVTYDHVASKAARSWRCDVNKASSKLGRPICLDGYGTGSVVPFGDRYRCHVCGVNECNVPTHYWKGA